MPSTQNVRFDRRWRLLAVLGLIVLLAAVALPALAAKPGAVPGTGANALAAEADPSAKPDRIKKAKVPKVAVTLRGTVTATTDADGNPAYRMTSDGTTYDLDAGPPWFHGDNHPLKAFVGETVTVTGETAEGSTEVDVVAVNGTALREGGKPPWAGGWKRVGERHPGWSQEKADRMAEKAAAKAERMQAKFGDCFPPGQCKLDDAAED